MASLADYAPAQTGEPHGPSPRIAALLTLLAPGLGHIYIGQARRGITLFALVLVADILLMFSLMGVLARFWMLAISVALLFGLWIFIVIDATVQAARMHDSPRHSYNKWPIYAGAFLVACLLTAIPCIYGAKASSLGHLGVFRAASGSMEPTLHHGEYFLADATYYHNHQPSRGDVAVYVHPKQAGLHYIKRIVAVEGDRVAVKDGRAVVNGMVVVEPYGQHGGDQSGGRTRFRARRQPRQQRGQSRHGGARPGAGQQSDRPCHRRCVLTPPDPHGPLDRNAEQLLAHFSGALIERRQVTRGLDPRVHLLRKKSFAKKMDCRVKPGNDGSDVYRTNSRIALSRPSSVSGYIRPPMS
jgi:signal peptidase I